MSVKLADAIVYLMADSKGLDKGLADGEQQTQGWASKVGGFLKTAVPVAAIVGGIVTVGKALIDAGKAAAEEEAGIAKLRASVEASGGAWDDASAAIEGYLSKQLMRTALDDGAGREAISTLTNMTGDYSKALDLMGLAQDLAAAKSMDLNTAAEIVGKVASGNTGILGRYGIVLQEGATATEALATMQETFAGQAEAYGSTTEGAQKKMDVAFGNLKETVGTYVIPIMASFATTLADLAIRAIPIVEGALNVIGPVFQTVFGWIRDNVVPILMVIIGYIEQYWPVVSQTIGDVLREVWLVVSTVLTAVKGAWEGNLGGIRTIVTTVFNLIKGTIQNVMEVIRGIIKVFTSAIKGDWQGVWTGIQQIFTGVWNQIKLQLNTSLTLIKTVLANAWSAIRTVAGTAWEGIKNVIKAPINAIISMVNSMLSAWNALEIRIPGFGFDLPSVTILGQTIGGGHLGWAGATIGTPDIGLIPMLAKGGDFITRGPMLIGVGEAGPERVTVQPQSSRGLSGVGASQPIGGGDSELRGLVTLLVRSTAQLVEALGTPTDVDDIARELEMKRRMRYAT
jgi:hypothetical protein